MFCSNMASHWLFMTVDEMKFFKDTFAKNSIKKQKKNN